MKSRFTTVLALAAGFTGGLASRYIEPLPVSANAPATLQEIRAQKFILVDETGLPRAVFGIEENGSPEVEVIDSKGRVSACWFRPWKSPSSFGR